MKCFAIVLALAPLSVAQQLLYELEAPAGVTHYGQAVAALPDVDGDGRPDFALSAYLQRVELRSGASGALLGLRENPEFGYGYALAGAGDTDGDGRADLLVGSPGFLFELDELDPQPSPGFVELLSGKDASLLRRLDDPTGYDAEFGQSLLALGDLNGDGHADFAVGAPAHVYAAFVPSLTDPGHVHAYSGADGSPLWTAAGAQPFAGFGVALSALPDLDGDGVAELAVGAPGSAFSSTATPPPAEIDIVSGVSGAVLRRIAQPPSEYANGFGASLATVRVPGALPQLLVGRHDSYGDDYIHNGAVLIDLDGTLLASTEPLGIFDNKLGISVAAGDITGDGQPELLVGHGAGSSVAIFDASLEWRNALGGYNYAIYAGPPMGESVSTSCAVLGDVTGDGVAELLEGESSAGGDAQHQGRVRVFEGGAGPWTKLDGATPSVRKTLQLVPYLTRTPLTAYSPDSGLRIGVESSYALELEHPYGRLVIGLQTQNKPLAGGVLVPAPLFTKPLFDYPDVTLDVQLPPTLASGLTFYVQAVVVESDGTITLSDAWKGELP